MVKERTFIAVKVDGIQRGLVGEIIKRFEIKGFKLVALKMSKPSEEHWKNHYGDLSEKPFFNGLVKYMSSGPVIAMCWEGTGVVKTARQMMGETKPADSKPGTIRGDFCIEVGRNIIHGSDSVESAEKELAMWFKKDELVDWSQANNEWIYEYLDRFSVKSEKDLLKLNNYLEDHSYIHGHSKSDADYILYKRINVTLDQVKLPYCYRWYNHIKAITDKPKIVKDAVGQNYKSLHPNLSAQESKGSEKNCEHKMLNGDIKNSDIKPILVRNLYAAMLEIKAKEDVSANIFENLIRDVKMKGLKWGASKVTTFPHVKMSIVCIFDEEYISIHDVLIKLCKHENYVRDADIRTFYKI